MSPPMVIAGMHRSGTSMVAGAFAKAGLRFGDRLLPPSRANPRGYYEDTDVIAWHDAALADLGLTWYDPQPTDPLPVSADRVTELRRMVATKFPGDEPWGIKDPRSTLFLDTWAEAFPQAKFLLVHRDAALVAWSLLRRRDFDGMDRTRLARARRSLRLWQLYNDRMLDFARRYPDRCRLLRVPDDVAASYYWGHAGDFAASFKAELIQKAAPRWLRVLAHATTRPVPRRKIAIVTPRSASDCETFIRAHIDCLPGDVRVLHGGDFPRFDHAGRPLRPGDQGLARYFKQQGIDAVLAEYGPTGASVARACELAGVPLVVHFHGYDAYLRKTITAHTQRYATMFRSAAAVVVVSQHMRSQLLGLGCPEGKIHLVPYGVDLDRFAPAEPADRSLRFVAVGRLVAKKAPHLTIRAFAQVLSAYPDAQLVMIGDGPLYASCRKLIDELGVTDSVALPGALPHERVAAMMRGARAFVQHSVHAASGDAEGTPVAVLEAGAAQLPVVATRHAGIVDAVVDEKTGLLVDECDVDAMARCMVRLAGDPELAESMGRAARQRIERLYHQPQQIARLDAVVSTASAGGADLSPEILRRAA